MRLNQIVIVTLLVASVAACTKWVPDTRPLPTEQGKGLSRARLHMGDGQVLTITGVLLRGDSIVGWSGGRRMTLPTADITKIEREVVDGVKTGIVVGSVAALVAGFVLAGQSLESNCCFTFGRSERDMSVRRSLLAPYVGHPEPHTPR